MIEYEKDLEKKLTEEVSANNGWTIKLLSYLVTGLPDRLCLFPQGIAVFCEVKTTGIEPTKIQKLVHRKLDRIGFKVWIIDSTEKINLLIDTYAT